MSKTLFRVIHSSKSGKAERIHEANSHTASLRQPKPRRSPLFPPKKHSISHPRPPTPPPTLPQPLPPNPKGVSPFTDHRLPFRRPTWPARTPVDGTFRTTPPRSRRTSSPAPCTAWATRSPVWSPPRTTRPRSPSRTSSAGRRSPSCSASTRARVRLAGLLGLVSGLLVLCLLGGCCLPYLPIYFCLLFYLAYLAFWLFLSKFLYCE